MQGVHRRKYGVETTIPFVLFGIDGVSFKTDAVHAFADTKIMKDEGDEANTDNGFADEGQGYSITVSETEMEAARIVVYIADQAVKAWLDTAFVIETYGHENAQHEFDDDSAEVTTDAASRNASKAAGFSTHSAAAAGAAAGAAVVADAAFKRLLAFEGEYRRVTDLAYDAGGEVTSAVIKLYNSKEAFDADEPDAIVDYSATVAGGRVTSHTSERQE